MSKGISRFIFPCPWNIFQLLHPVASQRPLDIMCCVAKDLPFRFLADMFLDCVFVLCTHGLCHHSLFSYFVIFLCVLFIYSDLHRFNTFLTESATDDITESPVSLFLEQHMRRCAVIKRVHAHESLVSRTALRISVLHSSVLKYWAALTNFLCAE